MWGNGLSWYLKQSNQKISFQCKNIILEKCAIGPHRGLIVKFHIMSIQLFSMRFKN